MWVDAGAEWSVQHQHLRLGVPTNLRVELSSFVGRVAEIDRAAELLSRTRLLTLSGAGGCGKTRLARQVAVDVAPRFPAGVWWVELASLTDGALVAETLARLLGVSVEGGPAVDAVAEYFSDDDALVVLDNCEHLVDAVAEFADVLLRGTVAVRVLATSRQPLGVQGEVTWRVPSMESPPLSVSAEGLSRFDASYLFLERTMQSCPDLRLTEGAATAVAQICRRLDGIPLALELAAAHAGSLSLDQIVTELDNRFSLLTGGPRTAVARHRTLLASVEWSYELLDVDETVLLRRLGEFVGGFPADAAVAVGGFAPLSAEGVVELLSRLVERCLVQREDVEGNGRYRLLETIREFAGVRLRETAEYGVVAERHLRWVLELAEGREAAMVCADLQALDDLERELPNVRAALDHAATMRPADHAGLRLVTASAFFWAQRGLGLEGADRAVRVLDTNPDAPAMLRARAWAAVAYDRFYGGDFEKASADAEAGLSEATVADDVLAQARCHHAIGMIAFMSDPPASRRAFSRALTLARAAHDRWCEADSLQFLAFNDLIQHRPLAAQAQLTESGAMADAAGNAFQQACHQLGIALIAMAAGEFDRAEEAFHSGADGARQIGDPVIELWGRASLVTLALCRRRFQELNRIAAQTGRPGRPLAPVQEAFVAAVRQIAGGEHQPTVAVEGLFTVAELLRTTFVPNEGFRLALLGVEGALALGDIDGARAVAEQTLAHAERFGSTLAGPARVLLGRLARRAADPATAERLVHDGLVEIVEAGLQSDVPAALEVLGGIALDAESPAEATRLLAAAATLRATVGQPGAFTTEAEGDQARAADTLGDDFKACWAEGCALDVEAAVAYARRARGERKRPAFGWDSLTPTELNVVRLITAGLTNPAIGERLFISRGTVKTHLEHIYAKLSLRGRAELAATAARRGLT